VVERLLALGEGLSELKRARDVFEVALFFDEFVRYAEALQYYEKRLAIMLTLLGPEHPRVADTRYNLAMLHKAQDRRAEARAEFERAAAIYSHAIGPDYKWAVKARREAAAC
jgi:tetratricopeptide (TPR) repeat protein